MPAETQHKHVRSTSCLTYGLVNFYKIIWAVDCICYRQDSEQVIVTQPSLGACEWLRLERKVS